MEHPFRTPEETPAPLSSGLGAVRRKPRLLVVMLAQNEERTVGDVVRRVPETIAGISKVEVLVVDDGSEDRTGERARKAGAKVLRLPYSQGLGAAFHAALRYGIRHGADLIASIDADGQFDPADLPILIEPVLAGEAEFATASRFKDPSLVPEMPRMKLWGNRMMSWLISRIAGQKFYDVSCGMRCYSREAALQLNLLGKFTYTQEVILTLAFKQLPIAEVPIRVRGERAFGESRVAHHLWWYGFRTVQIIFRCYRDYHPMRFFGTLAAGLLLPALGLATFLLFHYLAHGSFSPHKWAGFTAATLAGFSLILFLLGVTADMLSRSRIYLEEILYRLRRETDTYDAAQFVEPDDDR